MNTITRKEIKAKKRAKWIATPPGIIQKPLRHIGNRLNTRDAQGQLVIAPGYMVAFNAARRGDGLSVQQMARSLA